ncbi:MAG: cytochrome P450 [Anaerolineales bacterium]|nr:cytochrome P450 [Anaerolineales bacterium]
MAEKETYITNLQQRVPGPKGIPFLGSSRDFQRDPLGFITRMAREYGEVSLFRLGNLNFHQVAHPEGIQHVLQENNRNFVKGKLFQIIREVGGDGLFTSEGDHWLRQRRLMQPAFHRQRIAGFGETMVHQAQRMLDRWSRADATRSTLDINQEMSDLTMEIITETMFGTQVEADTHAISRAVSHLLSYLNFRFEYPFYPGMRVPTVRNLQARRSLALLDQLVYGMIDKRRRNPDGHDDLLSLLMDARDEDTGEAMTDLQLRDEVITVFVAGHETTAAALTWTFYLLSENQDAEARLHGELEEALGGQPPDMAALPDLKYTRMVIDESMRLYPPAWITNRTCVEDDVVCGYRIPAGDITTLSPYVTHRLERYWPDPERFDPERFNPDTPADRPRYAYFPFGGGPHQCIGNSFALVEATLILAAVAQRFRLRLQPGYEVVPDPQVTLRPRGGMPMMAASR